MPLRTLPVQIGDRTFPLTSDDTYLDYVAGGFEPGMVSFFRALLNPGDHVLDIGANIGCTALLFGQYSREVRAFEPSPSTYALLAANVAASGLGNVYTHNFGLGDRECESEITFAPNNRSGGFVSDRTTGRAGFTTERIQLKPLDALFLPRGSQPVDFIKIDAEGFEGHVLRGAAQTVASSRPVVTLELNHWCLNAFQRTSIPDFFDFLRGMFPVLYAVDEKTRQRADLHDSGHSYEVMYHHIIHFKWMNVVGAFEPARLDRLFSEYPSI